MYYGQVYIDEVHVRGVVGLITTGCMKVKGFKVCVVVLGQLGRGYIACSCMVVYSGLPV